MPATASRLSHFTESVIRAMTRLSNQHGAINLSQGFPDFDPPEEILAALERATRGPFHQYAVTWGAPRFRQALAATPDYPDALNNLGYALLLAGQPDEARALYEKALALQPDFPEALNNLGLIAGRAGDLPTAERRFREALARRPAYGEATNNLALALVAQGRGDEAVALLEDLVTRLPAFEDAYVTLAKIHLAAGRTSAGLQAVQRLLQRNATHPVGTALLREYGPR